MRQKYPSIMSSSTSSITPQSFHLRNARVVAVGEDGSLSILRPLYSADVLCGRGGLVNNYIGNDTFRKLVKAKQEDYVSAKKKDKKTISRGIVESIQNNGGLFLRRLGDASGGKGSSKQKAVQIHSSDNYWEDIGTSDAIEKTSQSLREGLNIRKKKSGSSEPSLAAIAGAPAPAPAPAALLAFGSIVVAASAANDAASEAASEANVAASTIESLNSIKRKASGPLLPVAVMHLVSFLPVPVASHLSMSPATYLDHCATEEGRQMLAQTLFDWRNAMSEAELPSDFWLMGLQTVSLWRCQIDLWRELMLRSIEGESKAPPRSLTSSLSPVKKARGAIQPATKAASAALSTMSAGVSISAFSSAATEPTMPELPAAAPSPAIMDYIPPLSDGPQSYSTEL